MEFIRRQKLITLVLTVFFFSYSNAYSNPHFEIQKSLVHLSGFATAADGPLAGEKDGLRSQGTGFFIGGDGFILTTAHFFDPLYENGGRNHRIEGSIGDIGAGTPVLDIKFVTQLKNLDIALLKVDLPFAMEKPLPLKLGSSSQIDPANPKKLFTSGFHGNEYRQREGSFNKESSDAAPYVWSMNIKTNPGQSGSPVYFDDGTVVGIIKGVKREDDTLTLVVPIEYSLPLIGHFRIEEIEKQLLRIAELEQEIEALKELNKQVSTLTERVELLSASIGETKNPDAMPIQFRLGSVEKNLEEIGKQFFWYAETNEDNGSLTIRYEKLVSDGPQIENIDLKVKTNMRMTDDASSPVSLKLGSRTNFNRNALTPDKRGGEFIVPDIQSKLETMYNVIGDSLGPPEPYKDLELTVIPNLTDSSLPPKRIKLVPVYNWKKDE